MAVKHELEISIGPDGTIEFEVKGVKGADCLELTRELEEALGVVKSRTNTSEFYQQAEEQKEKIKLRND